MVVAIPAAGIRLWSGGAVSPSTAMHMRRYAHQVDSDSARLTTMAPYHAWTPPRSQWSTVGAPALRCERRVRECDASSEEKTWIAIRHKPRFIAETTPWRVVRHCMNVEAARNLVRQGSLSLVLKSWVWLPCSCRFAAGQPQCRRVSILYLVLDPPH